MNSRSFMLMAGLIAVLPAYAEPLVLTTDTTYTKQSELDAAADGIVINPGVTLTLNPGASGTLSVNRAISGEGGIAVTSGKVTFTVSSSYSGGTSVYQAGVECQKTDALGSGEVSIDGATSKISPYVAYLAGSKTAGEAVVRNDFRLKTVTVNPSGTAPLAALRFPSAEVGDQLSFAGKVTCEEGFSFLMEGGASKVVTFAGGIDGPADGGPYAMSLGGNKGSGKSGNNNQCIFDCVINAPTFQIRSTNGSFEFGFKKPGNAWLDLNNDRTAVTCYGENVLAANGDIVVSTYGHGTVNLNGYSQTIRNLDFVPTTGSLMRDMSITTPTGKPATLTMCGTHDCVYDCYLKGPLSLTWNAAGGHTFKIGKNENYNYNDASLMTISGTLTAANGTLTVDSNRSLPKIAGVSASGNGRIDIPPTSVPVSSLTVSAKDDGVINLPAVGIWQPVKSLALDETPCKPGYYMSSDAEPKEGAVTSAHLGLDTRLKIPNPVTPEVTPVPAYWQGSAGLFSAAGSWVGSPDFTSGSAVPTFASDAVATVDGEYKVGGFTFAAGGVYTLAAGDGAQLVLSQGVTVIPAGATVVFDAPIEFVAGHRFEMGYGAVVSFNGKLSGSLPETVTFISPAPTTARETIAVAKFTSDESDLCADIHFDGVCAVAKGTSPFGSGLGTVTFDDRSDATAGHVTWNSGTRVLSLEGATIANQILHRHDAASGIDTFYVAKNTVNTFKDLVTITDKSRYINVQSGSQLIFEGGVNFGVNNFYATCWGTGENQGVIIVRNKPFVAAKSTTPFSNGKPTNIRLECAGNCLGNVIFSYADATTGLTSHLTLAADDALVDTQLNFTKGTIDLNGHDVTFLHQSGNSASTAVLTSATSATLYFAGQLNDTTPNTVGFTIDGEAGVGQKGTGTLCFAKPLARAVPLALAEQGTLQIDSATMLSQRTRIVVDGEDWKIRVADGVTVIARALVDAATGEEFKSGTYGGLNSNALYKMTNFGEGTGLLSVGRMGLMLFVR